jgi:hypothetical protein
MPMAGLRLEMTAQKNISSKSCGIVGAFAVVNGTQKATGDFD